MPMNPPWSDRAFLQTIEFQVLPEKGRVVVRLLVDGNIRWHSSSQRDSGLLDDLASARKALDHILELTLLGVAT